MKRRTAEQIVDEFMDEFFGHAWRRLVEIDDFYRAFRDRFIAIINEDRLWR